MDREINKFHALQLFTDTFAAETVHLSNSKIGIYIRLLCFAWTKNTKPFKTESAYRICYCKDDDCKLDVDEVLGEFFKVDPKTDSWTHKRLVQEHDYLTNKYKARSKAGRKGGLASSKNQAPIPIPNPNPNNKYIYSDSFEQLWSLLKIKRGSKFKAHQEFNKVDGNIGLDIEEIAKIYNAQQKDIEDKFVPHFSTWLYQRRWENDEKREESITIVQKMENLGYVFRHTEANFDYFKKDGIEYKIDKYDKDHIIHKVE